MNISTQQFANVVQEIPAGQLTMAALIDRINADTSLTVVRRRNLTSSIRRFCAAMGYDPKTAPADHGYYRDRLKRFHPLSVGIQKKRWQTIKSDVGFAFRQAGIVKERSRPRLPYSADWQAFRARFTVQKFRLGLSRFVNFCNRRNIRPRDVCDGVIEAYDLAYRQESFKIRPERHLRQMCQLWNQAAALASELDLQCVIVPSNREVCTSPWDDLPDAFRTQAEAFLTGLSVEADLLSETGPIKPLRPASIKTYRYTLRQIFAALANSGIAPETINTLDMLVQDNNARTVLQHFLDRNDGKPSSMIANIAHVLVIIAEGRVDPKTLLKLKRYRRQLAMRRSGLKPRPRESLRPFVDASNVEKILILPLRIFERVRKKSVLTHKYALQMQVALALELLLMRPIRRKNLVALRLDKHVVRSARNTFIVIEAEDTKNNVELDYRIPRESVALLDFYVEHLLPLCGDNPSKWLFPGQSADRHKSPEQFARQFVKVIREETGLHFYLHLSRHFGAFLWLKENPGAFETMRRVLAHKSLSTTTQSYASFDDNAAVQLFDTMVLRIRDSISREVKDD
jgi:integrase